MKRARRRTIVASVIVICLLVVAGAAILAHRPPDQARGLATDLNVRSFGATGDGSTDDSGAFATALAAAARSGRRLVVPAGTYRVGQVGVPNGVRLRGAGSGVTWLKGQLVFGSHDHIVGLKLGDAGLSAVRNADGATSTIFSGCRLRGGGGTSVDEAVVALGYRGDCHAIVFRQCEVECNLGTEDSAYSRAFNDITVFETKGAHVDGVTFDHCHVGVSNGLRSGSPRMGLECYVVQRAEGGSGRGYEDIVVRDCTFEATDIHCIDLADAADGRAHDVLIEGCLLKGGGKAMSRWGYTICVECPQGVVIRDNTIWRGSWETLNFAHPHRTGPGTIVTGNRFDLVHDNGIATLQYNPVLLTGRHIRFTRNTLSFDGQHRYILQLNHASYCTISDNVFRIGRRHIYQTYNLCHDNLVSRNVLH